MAFSATSSGVPMVRSLAMRSNSGPVGGGDWCATWRMASLTGIPTRTERTIIDKASGIWLRSNCRRRSSTQPKNARARNTQITGMAKNATSSTTMVNTPDTTRAISNVSTSTMTHGTG